VIQQAVSTVNPAPAGDALRRKALQAVGALPPFSPILNKLLASLAGEDVSFIRLGELIEKDTVVAGNVLRMVNSALYARRSTVNSVRHALSVLGVDKVRNTVLAMSISRMLNHVKTPGGFSMERFNKHSAAVAVLSDQLAQRVPVDYPEGAFVAGLLHDVGRMLIAMALPRHFERILEAYQRSDRSWVECEREALGFTHAELSAEVLQVWKIPEEIQVAVREHHLTPECYGEMTLSRILDAANQYVNAVGESILPKTKSDAAGSAWIEALGLSPRVLAEVLQAFEAEHNALGQFYK
jgi:putative nucleotidyltransferase with HDIG domain